MPSYTATRYLVNRVEVVLQYDTRGLDDGALNKIVAARDALA